MYPKPTESFTGINLLNPPNTPLRTFFYYPQFFSRRLNGCSSYKASVTSGAEVWEPNKEVTQKWASRLPREGLLVLAEGTEDRTFGSGLIQSARGVRCVEGCASNAPRGNRYGADMIA